MAKQVTLRPAVAADQATLERWDTEPHVISATTDDPTAAIAFGDHDWAEELAAQSEVFQYYLGEVAGRPVGAMLIIDPQREPNHYWGECAANLRAIDIWLGDAADLGQGYGEVMMRQACDLCFADPAVTAVLIDPLASNLRSHKFYRRLGFVATGQRFFGEDDCLVHELSRAGLVGLGTNEQVIAPGPIILPAPPPPPTAQRSARPGTAPAPCS